MIEQLLRTTELGRFLHHSVPGIVSISVWSTIVIELGLPFCLLFAKARWWAVLIGLGFHAGMLVLTGRGSVFHFFLPITYFAFFMPMRFADFANQVKARRSYSIAAARSQLTEIIDEVEGGEDVEILRRGKKVAMLVSPARYERLPKRAFFGKGR